jgi:SAM-dependent methyltransferase
VDALAAFPERPVEFYSNVISALKARPQMAGRGAITDRDIDAILSVNSGVRWNEQRVRYVTPVRAEGMPFQDNEFDFVYSNASFEHFEEPRTVIDQIFRVLKRGALTAHVIDLRDHVDFSKPFEFLRVGRAEYRYTSPYGTNRWRASDFKKAFSEAGFDALSMSVTEQHSLTDEQYNQIHADLRGSYTREDLEILGITVVGRKP